MGETAKRILVLGGARSGKSRYAEALGETVTGNRIYIATAQARDTEMTERIAAHRKRRENRWTTLEEPLNLAGALANAGEQHGFILIDCLTLWLSNLLLAEQDCERAVESLIETLDACAGTVVIVSNEVGGGIVPDNELARRFRDVAGTANQRLAQACDEVVLVTAGLPQILKPAR